MPKKDMTSHEADALEMEMGSVIRKPESSPVIRAFASDLPHEYTRVEAVQHSDAVSIHARFESNMFQCSSIKPEGCGELSLEEVRAAVAAFLQVHPDDAQHIIVHANTYARVTFQNYPDLTKEETRQSPLATD